MMAFVFPPRREVLKARAGTLSQTPLPLLLHALLVEERSATLELKLRNLEKRLFFDAGVPVGCESNLLHETLGPSLVAKGTLTDAQHHGLLSESALAGKPLQALLLEKQLISGFDLVRHLQAVLGRTVLDAFRWTEATWRLLPLEEPETPIRMNTAQLVFTGCMQLPVALLEAHLALPPAQAFAFLPDAPAPQDKLKLSAKDTRLLQAIKRRAPLSELSALPGLPREDLHRKLYALRVLEFIDTTDAVDARPIRSLPTPAPAPAPVATTSGLPFLDDDPSTRDRLASESLSFRTKDAFELLGVDVDCQGSALQKAFLARSNALSPVRFQQPDNRARAEALQLAYARAFGALSEPESWQQHRARRAARDAHLAGAKARASGTQFQIRTELLDAQSQFDEGRKRLAAGTLRAAIEHLQYAVDIEPRPRFVATLAWAKYQAHPAAEGKRAHAALVEACAQDPACEEAWVWRAELATALNDFDDARDAYRQLVKLAPANPRYRQAADAAAAVRRR
jgi:hypothetical protein